MLIISQVRTAKGSVILKLEGRVVGPWVAELRHACESASEDGRPLELDLAEVSFADAEGLMTLTRLRARGVALTNCSPFVEEQLKSVVSAPSPTDRQ